MNPKSISTTVCFNCGGAADSCIRQVLTTNGWLRKGKISITWPYFSFGDFQSDSWFVQRVFKRCIYIITYWNQKHLLTLPEGHIKCLFCPFSVSMPLDFTPFHSLYVTWLLGVSPTRRLCEDQENDIYGATLAAMRNLFHEVGPQWF